MQNINQRTTTRTQTYDLIITAMLIALVFVATIFINIKLPITANGGLVHLGTAMLFTISVLFGPKKGAIAGAFGMAIFDLVSGWTLWAPFTFVARGLQGYIVGKIAWSGDRKGRNVLLNAVGMVVSAPIMLGVYYVCEGILYGNWIAPAASIPGNLVQIVVGMIVALPVAVILKRLPMFK